MKTYLKKTILFFIPIVILAIVVEVMARQLPNSYKLKRDYLETNSANIQTLCLGSSHTFYGINPEYIQGNVFNAGNISQSLHIDYAILNTYKFPNLKQVIIRLSYDTLFEELGIGEEHWRLKNYKLYSNLKLNYKFTHHFEILSLSLKKNVNNLYDYYIKQKDIVNSSALGWGNKKEIYSIDLETNGLKRAIGHTAKDWSLLERNKTILNELISFCNKKNIEVILITPPAYKSYYNNLDQKQLNTVTTLGKKLAAKYINCRYYNYLKHPSFLAHDFFDSDHLNANGAKKFSLLINKLLSK